MKRILYLDCFDDVFKSLFYFEDIERRNVDEKFWVEVM